MDQPYGSPEGAIEPFDVMIHHIRAPPVLRWVGVDHGFDEELQGERFDRPRIGIGPNQCGDLGEQSIQARPTLPTTMGEAISGQTEVHSQGGHEWIHVNVRLEGLFPHRG